MLPPFLELTLYLLRIRIVDCQQNAPSVCSTIWDFTIETANKYKAKLSCFDSYSCYDSNANMCLQRWQNIQVRSKE